LKRIKRRYLKLQLDTNVAVSERQLMEGIWGALSKLYGEFGASLASLALISFDEANKKAILRTNLVAVDNVRVAIASITSISGNDAAVHVSAISGTIKALREKS
jgi:RNase P/RNase MRP subunit POP5